MEADPYESPQIKTNDATENQSISRFAIAAAVVLTLSNLYWSFIHAFVGSNNIHYSIGSAFGSVFFGIIIVGLFQLSKAMRNSKSRLTIYNWTLFVSLLSNSIQKFALVTT